MTPNYEYIDPEEEERAQEEAMQAAMEAYEEYESFTKLLMANELKTPNDFTIKMGDLVRQGRETIGISQADLAKKLHRRQATISDIENGKSEISILTLAAFAIVLHKPISYFFPESLLKDQITDVKSSFEYKVVEIAREIEEYKGDKELTLDLLKSLKDNFMDKYYESMQEDPNVP